MSFKYFSVCYPLTGQMFVLTRRCPCWGGVSLVSRLLPAWLRCGNRAAPATDGVWATREGKGKKYPHCTNTMSISITTPWRCLIHKHSHDVMMECFTHWPSVESELIWSGAIFISSIGMTLEGNLSLWLLSGTGDHSLEVILIRHTAAVNIQHWCHSKKCLLTPHI